MSNKAREVLEIARRFVYASAQTMGRDILVNDKCGKPYIITPQYALEKIDEALAEPLRNCDVGTAEEQAKRFRNFCAGNSSRIDGMCDPKCPCIASLNKHHCLCMWQQLPYESSEQTKTTETKTNKGE